MLYLCYKNQSADILEKKFILRKNVTHEVILQTKFWVEAGDAHTS
jgi:hypothetical protein